MEIELEINVKACHGRVVLWWWYNETPFHGKSGVSHEDTILSWKGIACSGKVLQLQWSPEMEWWL